MLTPTELAYVCPGQQITFTCETNTNFLRWNITFLDSGYTDERLVSSYGVSDITSLRISATSFNFTRVSEMPLVVTLMISNVTTDLRIRCKEYTELSSVNTLSTLVLVVYTQNKNGNLTLSQSNDIVVNISLFNSSRIQSSRIKHSRRIIQF